MRAFGADASEEDRYAVAVWLATALRGVCSMAEDIHLLRRAILK
jgi:hypothetical protein